MEKAVSRFSEVGFIGIGKRLTRPQIGSPKGSIGMVNGHTMVKRLKGFSADLEEVKTVNDFKVHVMNYLRLPNGEFRSSQVHIFDHRGRVMHGAKSVTFSD